MVPFWSMKKGGSAWSTHRYACIHTVPSTETCHVIVPVHFLPVLLSPEAGGSFRKAFHLLASLHNQVAIAPSVWY